MTKRTFVLFISEQDKEYVDADDINNLLSIRAAEVFIEANQVAEVSLEFISNLKTFVKDNMVKDEVLLKYSVDIDFNTI